MIIASIIAGIVLLLVLSLILLYNGMVRGRNMVDEAWSGISVQLKRRHDLIPSLVNAVKGYMTHEQETLTRITELRSQAISASSSGSLETISHAENQLMGALRSLFAVSENYPALRASENFMQLQEQDDYVAGWSESTMKKIRQILIRVLAENEYLDDIKADHINPVWLNPVLENAIRSNNDDRALAAFNCFS